MWKKRITALILLVIAYGVAYYAYDNSGYKLGLDLSGGTHLVFRANTENIPVGEINDAMTSLSHVVERRVNLFGVSEPIVQVEQGGVVGQTEHRLIVELPGIEDLKSAVDLIGKTPSLEFRLLKPGVEKMTPEERAKATLDDMFYPAELSGRFLQHAALQFDQTTYQPQISIEWNDVGGKLFADITKSNVGKALYIFLDGNIISNPVIQQEISSGKAVINGSFKVEEARTLVRNLNLGALPVPISLISSNKVGATLGKSALDASVFAGIVAFIIVGIFLVLWYRLPGVVATVALAIYVALNLAIFKAIL